MTAMAGRRCGGTVIRSISVVLERGGGRPLPAGAISAPATRESHVSCHARAFGHVQLQSGSAADASASASPPFPTAGASSCSSSSPRKFSTSLAGMTATWRRAVSAHPPATWHSSASLTQGRRQIAGWTNHRAAREVYNRHRQILVLNDKEPDVAVDAYVAPNATLIGDVEIEDRATIWYGCVLRGDLSKVKVGFYSSIQEKSVIHSAPKSAAGGPSDTVIGRYVSVGAGCTLRACTIEDQVVVGDRCVVMEGAVVEKNAILEAGSLVPPGRLIVGQKLWAGNPARYVRDLTADEIAAIPTLSVAMHTVAGEHASEFLPYSSAYLEAEALKETLAGKAAAT